MSTSPDPRPRLLRQPASPTVSDPASDAALLTLFVRRGDQEAFALLVRRHGPLVLGVCRRVLHDAHEAEDVAQATFLVLARKAATVRPKDRLAAWLHGVARRMALNARRADERRRRRDALAFPGESARQRDPLEELTARELLTILDEELHRLPEMYRLPVILCALEGQALDEAAAQLGWAPGSVRGRLARGRQRLQAGLTRRGLSLSVALAAAEATRGFVAAGMATLLARAPSAAAALARGTPWQAVAGVSERALVLARASLKGMATLKLKMAMALTLAISLAAVQGTLAASQADGAKKKETRPGDGIGYPSELERPPGAVGIVLGMERTREARRVNANGFREECRRQDLNLHWVNPNQALNLARLPIPPLRLRGVSLTLRTDRAAVQAFPAVFSDARDVAAERANSVGRAPPVSLA
jgi:RNA polymerase sigma factor (sigma-70 family)